MKKVMAEINELELKLAETGPRGGNIIGKTESGKPIYESRGNKNHKDFTKKDHLDAAQVHERLRSQAADDYHFKQKNQDGTVSPAHIKKRKQLFKQMEHHDLQAKRHRFSAEDRKPTPDQKDWDKMDRKNDPQHRSKSWSNLRGTHEKN